LGVSSSVGSIIIRQVSSRVERGRRAQGRRPHQHACRARVFSLTTIFFFDNSTLHLCDILSQFLIGVLVLACSTLAPDRATIPIILSLSKHLLFFTFIFCRCKDAPHASMLPPKRFPFTRAMEMFFVCFLGIPLLATYPNVSRLSRTDVLVNDLVSFDPQPSSFEFSANWNK